MSALNHLTALAGERPARKMGQVRWAWPRIEAALAAGHSLKSVWRSLEADGIRLPYKTLSRYVSRIRQEGPARRMPVTAAPLTADKLASRDPAANLRERLGSAGGFQFGGTGKKDDLV